MKQDSNNNSKYIRGLYTDKNQNANERNDKLSTQNVTRKDLTTQTNTRPHRNIQFKAKNDDGNISKR